MQAGNFIKDKAGRLVVLGATSVFAVGIGFMSSGTAHAIGGLCNGTPASHTWLDASGQYGPALLDGTNGDDTIVGSDGDDTISGGAGDDQICGAAGNDSIAGDSGDLAGGAEVDPGEDPGVRQLIEGRREAGEGSDHAGHRR